MRRTASNGDAPLVRLGGTAVLLLLAWKMLREVLRPHELELGPLRAVPAGRAGLFGRGFFELIGRLRWPL